MTFARWPPNLVASRLRQRRNSVDRKRERNQMHSSGTTERAGLSREKRHLHIAAWMCLATHGGTGLSTEALRPEEQVICSSSLGYGYGSRRGTYHAT
ncbi:hypothetical protein C8T65DRAFT_152463 [Cerioporus squamosus]|nr:hypothetical protein C8T65DRAFT_152463 [Cerioporus squamosus]